MNNPSEEKHPEPSTSENNSNFLRDNLGSIIVIAFILFVVIRCSQLQEEYDSPAAQAERTQKLRDAVELGRALDRAEGRYAPEP